MEGDEPNHIFEQEQCKFAFSMIVIPLRKLKFHWNYEIQSLLCCWRILENILKSLNSQAVMLIMCFTLISSVDHGSESEETMQDTLSRNCKLLSIIISSFTVLV